MFSRNKLKPKYLGVSEILTSNITLIFFIIFQVSQSETFFSSSVKYLVFVWSTKRQATYH